MLKKTITYTDFNDEEITEDLYFHLTKIDIVDLELAHTGGMEEWMKRVTKAEDGNSIFQEFKKIILASYGKRSEDGKRFVKNAEIREEFESSKAFEALAMDILTDTDKAIDFFKGIVPADVAEEAAKLELSPTPVAAVAPSPTPVEVKTITRAELTTMDSDTFLLTKADIDAGIIQITD
jgi:hypothetical protein